MLFDILGNWYMRSSIEQLCLSPQQPAWALAVEVRERDREREEGPLFSWSCRNPASSGAAQQSGAVVEETIPLSKVFPWEYWVTVWESSTVVFNSVSLGRLLLGTQERLLFAPCGCPPQHHSDQQSNDSPLQSLTNTECWYGRYDTYRAK